jgi:hypothetical protein
VVMAAPKGALRIDDDLIAASYEGLEAFVKLSTRVAVAAG